MVMNRKKDSEQESIINKFLDKYFFKKCFHESCFIYDVDTQIKGIDVVADGKNIDIKTQANYMNNPRPTFILELSFYNRQNVLSEGWFLNKNLETDYYMFVWIPRASTDTFGYISSPDNIEQAEIMIVDKKKLSEYIFSLISKQGLKDKCLEMIENTSCDSYELINGIKFHISRNFAECPCVLVVKKFIYKKFATKHCMVTKDSITDIA